MEILAFTIFCGIILIPTVIKDWVSNNGGFLMILRNWVIGPGWWVRPLTSWDWIFGWTVIASWAMFILYMLKGTGGLIRRKPKARSNFVTDLKLLGIGLALAAAWYGIRCLLAANWIFLKDNSLIPIPALYGRWWTLIPIPFAVFKVGTTLFRCGRAIVKKVSGIPSAIADKAGELVDTARTIAKEE